MNKTKEKEKFEIFIPKLFFQLELYEILVDQKNVWTKFMPRKQTQQENFSWHNFCAPITNFCHKGTILKIMKVIKSKASWTSYRIWKIIKTSRLSPEDIMKWVFTKIKTSAFISVIIMNLYICFWKQIVRPCKLIVQ